MKQESNSSSVEVSWEEINIEKLARVGSKVDNLLTRYILSNLAVFESNISKINE